MELGRDKTVGRILSRLDDASDGKGVVKVEGTWGSFGPMLVAYLSHKLGRPILYVSPHVDDADKVADDLYTFGGEKVDALSAWEGEEDLADATDEIRTERLKVVSRVSSLTPHSNDEAFIIPASVQSLC